MKISRRKRPTRGHYVGLSAADMRAYRRAVVAGNRNPRLRRPPGWRLRLGSWRIVWPFGRVTAVDTPDPS